MNISDETCPKNGNSKMLAQRLNIFRKGGTFKPLKYNLTIHCVPFF